MPGGEFDKNIENTLFSDRSVYLTKINLTGCNDMHEYSKLPEFYRYLEYKPHKTIDETKKYILSLLDRITNGYRGGECMYWFIRLINTGKVIGSINLCAVDLKRKSAEVGLGISPKYWGKGHIFEALYILLNFCIEKIKLERIFASTIIDNNSVICLFETAGFKVEGTLREAYLTYDGKRCDAIILGLLKREATLSRCHAFSKLLLNKGI